MLFVIGGLLFCVWFWMEVLKCDAGWGVWLLLIVLAFFKVLIFG